MPTIKEVCRHVRSKNAGPFWVTIDLFFDGEDNFKHYSESSALGPALFERVYGADPKWVRRYPAPSLNMVRFSYARTSGQGGEVERDMHGGQQFARIMDVEL